MPEAEVPHVIAGPSAVLARRYAAALYDMAEDSQQLEAVTADMRVLREQIAHNPDFQRISRNPRLTRSELVAIAKELSATLKIGPLATSFLELLGQNRRLTGLSDIIAVFLYEVHKRHGEKTAEVAAAKAFTSQQQQELAASLGKLMKSKVNVVVKEDPALLGGFVAKIESKLIDASLKGKLDRIERHLKTENNAAA